MIYAANLKMNKTRSQTREYMLELASRMDSVADDDRVIVFPSTVALDRYDSCYTVGAQNAYPAFNGAYTGEIGVEHLNEFGIKTILIGHSERRTLLAETQESVATKFKYFKNEGFEIIYCIGEPLEVREQGIQEVNDYLLAQFDGIDTTYEQLIVAYEPIWAIGTGRSATADEIAETHALLKKNIDRPLLYGGSVKADNIGEISSIDGVDGVLVGGASLQVDSFMDIVLG